MDVCHFTRPLIGLLVVLCSAMALSGCDGTSGNTVPFSAMTSPDGTGTSARFNGLIGVTSDGTNLYVADTNNHIIRKVVIASGVVTTLAGSYGKPGTANGIGAAAQFKSPSGITTDGTNLYVTDNGNRIRKIAIATGEVTTLAGGTTGWVDQAGTSAKFSSPNGITTDDGTNLYVADTSNNVIRKIVTATGEVSTLAAVVRGSTGFAFSSITSASRRAQFKRPFGITTDGTNLYVTTIGNNSVFKVGIASGDVTPLAVNYGSISGSALFSAMSSAKGADSPALFKQPTGASFDGTVLYITDTGNNTIRKIILATNEVTTVAGIMGTAGSSDGTGSAALFKTPGGIMGDATSLFVADTGNNTLRRIVKGTGEVTTFAGSAQ